MEAAGFANPSPHTGGRDCPRRPRRGSRAALRWLSVACSAPPCRARARRRPRLAARWRVLSGCLCCRRRARRPAPGLRPGPPPRRRFGWWLRWFPARGGARPAGAPFPGLGGVFRRCGGGTRKGPLPQLPHLGLPPARGLPAQRGRGAAAQHTRNGDDARRPPQDPALDKPGSIVLQCRYLEAAATAARRKRARVEPQLHTGRNRGCRPGSAGNKPAQLFPLHREQLFFLPAGPPGDRPRGCTHIAGCGYRARARDGGRTVIGEVWTSPRRESPRLPGNGGNDNR